MATVKLLAKFDYVQNFGSARTVGSVGVPACHDFILIKRIKNHPLAVWRRLKKVNRGRVEVEEESLESE